MTVIPLEFRNCNLETQCSKLTEHVPRNLAFQLDCLPVANNKVSENAVIN